MRTGPARQSCRSGGGAIRETEQNARSIIRGPWWRTADRYCPRTGYTTSGASSSAADADWYEEHGDPDGPPLVAIHGGIVTFDGSFGGVLQWLTQGRRMIGVELQGHGHTPDTGRPMSIERFADDVAELVDRVAGGGPADLWASASAP